MNCALCQIRPRDEESHIIPAFIYRWLKETSATGLLRNVENPNLRIQDGVKIPLLCKACEDTFSIWETKFANQVFYPLVERKTNQITYDSSLLLFCVSVLWRTLHYLWLRDSNKNEPLQPEFDGKLEPVYNRWKEFLLGQAPHPGEFEVHLFPSDIIKGGRLPDNPGRINMYLLRGTDINLICNRVRGYVFAKLPHILLLGRVFDLHPRFGDCSRIRVRKGFIGYKSYKMPKDIMNFMFKRANFIAAQAEKTSPRQSAKLYGDATRNPEKFRKSRSIEATLHDSLLKAGKKF